MEYIGSWPEFRRYARLTWDLTRREAAGRYSGTVMGAVWAFVNPLALLAVYSLIFGSIFQARWGGEGSTLDFALVLFIGLIVFNLFSECVNRAPTLIVTNPSYVKKIAFPLQILPLVILGSALFHAFISLFAWAVLYLLLKGHLNWTVVYVVLIYVPLCLTTLGLSLFLASIGVYLRDITQFTALVTQSMLFLSPVFYSVEQAPALLARALQFNPLTPVIEQSRRVMLEESPPDWLELATGTGVSVLVLILGLWWFRRTKAGFADVV